MDYEEQPDLENEIETEHLGPNCADAGTEKEAKTQADRLIALAEAGATFFHSPDNEAYADIRINGHRETHRVRSGSFKLWLRHQYFRETKGGCSNEAMTTAIETLAAQAQFEGNEHSVHLRVAEHDGAIYIDLGDADWRAIEVTAKGWSVIKQPPVRFIRGATMKPLPTPSANGDIGALRSLCNVTDDGFILVVSHLLAALRPNSNYPVLVLTGEQGTCKSTLCRLFTRLTDPRKPEARTMPRIEDDLIVAARGAHVLAFDNISGLPNWISDAVCRLATGGGAGKRQLYTDNDEILFEGMRPIVLNGIEDVATREDLVDRSTILQLQTITDDNRRTDAEIDAEFNKVAPSIFAALLDGLAAGLRNLPTIELANPPRMADFAKWAEACCPVYGFEGTFIEAYRRNRGEANELVITNSPVGAAVRRFMGELVMAGTTDWSGTAQALLDELTVRVSEQAKKERSWPKQPNVLSNKLRRVAPALRRVGIEIARDREGHEGERIISISITTHPGPDPSNRDAKDRQHRQHRQRGVEDKNTDGADSADDVLHTENGGAATQQTVICPVCRHPVRPDPDLSIAVKSSLGEMAYVHTGCLDQWRRQ